MTFRRLLAPGQWKHGYVPAVDGLRVLCILLISWFHIWQQSWLSPVLRVGAVTIDLTAPVRTGYLMVDLLLLLSGFLLFLPYAAARIEGQPLPELKAYYQKRALRILPSYYFIVLLTFFTSALPQYGSMRHLLLDLVSHLTFTHNLLPEGYAGTRFTGVLWTLAVEVQFYLIAPLVGRAFVKKPLLTYIGMTAVAFFYRFVYVRGLSDTAAHFNRLPAMLDVYANGMAAAWLCVFLKKKVRGSALTGIIAALIAFGCVVGVGVIMTAQSNISGYENVRMGQMLFRFPLTALGGLFIVAGSQASFAFQWLLSNRLIRFLASVSYNYYLWHAQLMLRLRALHIPPYSAEMPQMAGEQPWQSQYTCLCFIVALAAAVLFTYLIEKPCARLGKKLIAPRGRHSAS